MIDLTRLTSTIRVWSVDPGNATGFAEWEIGPDQPMTRTGFLLVPKGLAGFREFVKARRADLPNVIVAESFTQDGRTRRPELSPHAIQSYIAGVVDLAEAFDGSPIEMVLQPNTAKLTVAKSVLVDAGLWVTKAQSGWTDGRDINDTTIHGLSYAKAGEHMPTLEKYWPDKG